MCRLLTFGLMMACLVGCQKVHAPVQVIGSELASVDKTDSRLAVAIAVSNADLIVVGSFKVGTNDRKANTPIVVEEVLKGALEREKQLLVRFETSAYLVSPPRESRWIFFLLPTLENTSDRQVRWVVGHRDDNGGILPATDVNLARVRKVLAASPQ